MAPERTEIVVFEVRGRDDSQCDGCGEELGRGRWIRIVGPRGEKRAHCMRCAGLDHLILLPTGDPALTRRAEKLSPMHAVVVRWTRARKRYEREGWLVEEPAVERGMAELRAEGREPGWKLEGEMWVRTRSGASRP